ncbi:Htr2c [Phodopus roborovskii]|uniref:5-hydroxytryptamine receptor 2B n=1 Tax=Phodopus roborovskii TaxID=109678 RepID=A0AAU9YY44_PHORO|nr:Htr2c [Phodopus roborovskii]
MAQHVTQRVDGIKDSYQIYPFFNVPSTIRKIARYKIGILWHAHTCVFMFTCTQTLREGSNWPHILKYIIVVLDPSPLLSLDKAFFRFLRMVKQKFTVLQSWALKNANVYQSCSQCKTPSLGTPGVSLKVSKTTQAFSVASWSLLSRYLSTPWLSKYLLSTFMSQDSVSVPIPVIGLRDESKVFVNNTTCVLNDPNFVLIGSFVAFFIPLTIMVITYFLTIYVLRRQTLMLLRGHTEEDLPEISLNFLKCCCKKNAGDEENTENPNPDQKPRRKKKQKRPRGTMQAINNEKKASKVLGIVFFVFLIMWCPFFITNILSVLCEKSCNQKLMEKLLNVFVWIGYVCSGINPLVYTLFNKVYRRAFSKYLRCDYKPDKKPPIRPIPRVAATALSGRELNVNIYRHTNERVARKANDTEPGIEMQVENLELPVNPTNVVSERISSV